jgi:hypothetical protein
MQLSIALMYKVPVVRVLIHLEDDMASSEKEEPPHLLPTLGNEQSTGTLIPRSSLSTDG